MKHRLKLWSNILDDLGPPEGCIMPWWLILVHFLLFPVTGLQYACDSLSCHDLWRMTWTIRGISFSDRIFVKLALSRGELYRLVNNNGIITIEQVNDDCDSRPMT